MADILQISEGVSLAFHSLAYLSQDDTNVIPTCTIAKDLQVSENHLAKIHQRLTKAGLIRSVRGPQGGVQLARKSEDISMLNIYEVIEGAFQCKSCARDLSECGRSKCMFNGLLQQANETIMNYFKNTSLKDLQNDANTVCPTDNTTS